MGKPFTYTEETYNQFLLTTIKSVFDKKENIGFLAITENANDIKAAIDERKIFIIRTAFFVAIVILIFSFVLNRYFLKPIKTLVNFTKSIKAKDKQKTNIQIVKNRNEMVVGSANFTKGGMQNYYELGVHIKGIECEEVAAMIDNLAHNSNLTRIMTKNA